MNKKIRFSLTKTSILTTLVISIAVIQGCPNRQKPVDTSQEILIQVGQMTADLDRIVARRMSQAADQAMGEVEEQVEARSVVVDHCITDTDDECPEELDGFQLYREKMDNWYRLVSAIETLAGVLHVWEEVNDAWRASGQRPTNWEEVVCRPVGTATETVMNLLTDLDVEIPASVRNILGRTEELCQLGVIVSEMVNPSPRFVGGEEEQ